MSADLLVVDDDEATRDAVAELLKDTGLTVRTAEHGSEAIRLLGEMRPKAILVDLLMPVMNGWRFIESMRVSSTLSAIPIIAMSAHAAARPSGCSAFIPKPLTLERLTMAFNMIGLNPRRSSGQGYKVVSG